MRAPENASEAFIVVAGVAWLVARFGPWQVLPNGAMILWVFVVCVLLQVAIRAKKRREGTD